MKLYFTFVICYNDIFFHIIIPFFYDCYFQIQDHMKPSRLNTLRVVFEKVSLGFYFKKFKIYLTLN